LDFCYFYLKKQGLNSKFFKKKNQKSKINFKACKTLERKRKEQLKRKKQLGGNKRKR